MTLTEANNNAATMSKSKKKRMKRMQAKQRKAEGEAAPVNAIPDDSLNPLDKLRSRLVGMDFDLALVDKSMDEMWNLQLDYTDFDIVLAYIENNKMNGEPTNDESHFVEAPIESVPESNMVFSPSSPSGSSAKENKAVLPEETVVEAPPPVEVKPVAPEPIAPMVPEPESMQTGFVQTKSASTPATQSVTASEDTRKKKLKPKTFDLYAKLEIVANSDALNDGIIALTEWVTKAASPMEIEAFCSAKKSAALQTVIRRSILSNNSGSTGQLLDLIGSILRQVGIPSSALLSSAKSLGLAMRCASDAAYADESLSESIAKAVAENVVASIGTVVDQMNEVSVSTASTLKRLDSEITKLQSTIKTKANATIVDLMSNRDKCKSVTDKYSTMIEVSLNKTSSVESALFSLNKTEVNKSQVVEKILGDQYNDVIKSKSQFDTLKSRRDLTTSSFSQKDSLLVNINSLKSDKARITNRVEQLKSELERLTFEEKQVDAKIKDANNQMVSLEGSLSQEAREVESLMASAAQRMKTGDSVSSVADKVCEFANVMDNISLCQRIAPTENGGAQDDEGTIDSAVLGQFLASAFQYFSSEVETVEYLKKRAKRIQVQIPTLSREILECEALGMASTVADMKKKEKELRGNMMDDHELAVALIGEADVAKMAFIGQLGQFRGTAAFNSEDVASYAKILQDIDELFESIGVPKDGKWTNILTDYGARSTVLPTQSSLPSKKTGWGNVASTGGLAKSLLDIQKEEIGNGHP